MKLIEPPYPKNYDPNARCDYHAGVVGHSIENCWALKYKVQELINAKWLSFKEGSPSVGNNPLPGHGNTLVNGVKDGERQNLIREVKDVKTPMRVIFAELCKVGMIKRIAKKGEGCNFHIDVGHFIKDYKEFKLFVQDLMDKQLLQIGHCAEAKDIMMVDEHTLLVLRPLVVYYTNSALTLTPCVPKPITI